MIVEHQNADGSSAGGAAGGAAAAAAGGAAFGGAAACANEQQSFQECLNQNKGNYARTYLTLSVRVTHINPSPIAYCRSVVLCRLCFGVDAECKFYFDVLSHCMYSV